MNKIFFIASVLLVNISAMAQSGSRKILHKYGFENGRLHPAWSAALQDRLPQRAIDSLALIIVEPDVLETAWLKLVQAKCNDWNGFRDSLALPFPGVNLPDTVFVLTGLRGDDDGFTFSDRTICFDLTALGKAYGDPGTLENADRIDRIFAHEYTHLLHKAWAANHKFIPQTFVDSMLWECLYEGLGMYRSLHSRWLPVNGKLPGMTVSTLDNLVPVFAERMQLLLGNASLSVTEKERLHKNLSRGQVNQKWGAFPVAIWLAMEAEADPPRLAYWISKGPGGLLLLARKYMPGLYRQKFDRYLQQ